MTSGKESTPPVWKNREGGRLEELTPKRREQMQRKMKCQRRSWVDPMHHTLKKEAGADVSMGEGGWIWGHVIGGTRGNNQQMCVCVTC